MGATTGNRTPLDGLLSTTLDRYYKSGKMHDAIFTSNPTFAFLKDKGKIEYVDGGYQLAVNLMYGKNTTVGPYSKYEVLDITPTDGITQANYPWAQYAGAITIDGMTEFQNNGKAAIVKLLGEKVEQLTMSFAERMNADLWDTTITGDATRLADKGIYSIPSFIPEDPTTGIIGSVDASTNSWWRSDVVDGSGVDSFQDLKEIMNTAYNNSGKASGGRASMLMTSQEIYEKYEAGMQEQIRYSSSDNATAGFENIHFKGAKLMWDEEINSTNGIDQNIYYINPTFLKLQVAKGKDFRPGQFKSTVDQDARTANYLWYGQLVSSNRRKLGLIKDIAHASL